MTAYGTANREIIKHELRRPREFFCLLCTQKYSDCGKTNSKNSYDKQEQLNDYHQIGYVMIKVIGLCELAIYLLG